MRSTPTLWLRRITCALAVATCLQLASADPLANPFRVEVTLRSDGPTKRLAGEVVAADESGLTIRTGDKQQTLAWTELVPASAMGVKFRLIDKSKATDWLELGRWAWSAGLTSEARSALGNARRLDRSLGQEIDAILGSAPGSVTARPTPADPATKPADEAPKPAAEDAANAVVNLPPQASVAANEVVHYTTPTAAENAASIALTRRRMQEAQKTLEVKFVELETAHFLIYTDWDPREYNFLKEQCEGAYRVVAKQFNQPVDGNVFVGKLPIYMFATQKAFRRFAQEFDEFSAPEAVLGYHYSSPSEQGHMAMWKPTVGTGINAGASRDDAMRRWGRTLAHEFSHAFIHRYRSNAQIPRWLNEGTAEMIAEAALPTNNYHGKARMAALDGADLMPLFDDSNMPSGYYYPVMMTMAECLQKQDGRKFVALFDEIKSGTEPEEALKKIYNIDYTKLAEGWSRYAKALR